MNSGLFRTQSNTAAEHDYAAAAVESACKDLLLELKNLSAQYMFYNAQNNRDYLNQLHQAIKAGTDPQKLFKLITTVRNFQGETILQVMLKKHEIPAFFECMIYFFGEKITHDEWLLALTSNKDAEESTPLHAVAKNAVFMKSFLHAFESAPSRQMFSMFTTYADKRGFTPLVYAIETFTYDGTNTGQSNNDKYILDCFTDIPGSELFATFTQLKGCPSRFNLFTTVADANFSKTFIRMVKLLLIAPDMTINDLCYQLTKSQVIHGNRTLFDAICHGEHLTRELLMLVIETLTKSLSAEQLWTCFNTRSDHDTNTNLFSVAYFDFAVFLKVMDCFTGRLTTTQLIDAFMQEQKTPRERSEITTISHLAIIHNSIPALMQHLVNARITSDELVNMISRISLNSNLLYKICDTVDATALTAVLEACDKVKVPRRDIFAVACRPHDPHLAVMTPIELAADKGYLLTFLRYFKPVITLQESLNMLFAMPDHNTAIILRGPKLAGPKQIFDEIADELGNSPELSIMFFTSPINRHGETMRNYARTHNWPHHPCTAFLPLEEEMNADRQTSKVMRK